MYQKLDTRRLVYYNVFRKQNTAVSRGCRPGTPAQASYPPAQRNCSAPHDHYTFFCTYLQEGIRFCDAWLLLSQFLHCVGYQPAQCFVFHNTFYGGQTHEDSQQFQCHGISTAYLLGVSGMINHPDTDHAGLHLSDEMLKVLASGKNNNRLLC